ncbi:MAG TPA: allantoinase AllB [Streptosporangiaceae bacterium]|nr:allantoinase AllB [Streptosporangiaceae bacterium]
MTGVAAPDLVIRARRVLTPDGVQTAEVLVRDGTIASVTEIPMGTRVSGSSPAETRLVVLDDDEVLLPGLVDTHVHVNEPGRTDWEGFATATAAAAAGGVTTIIDMPLNSVPPTVDRAALIAKRGAAAGQCSVDVGFWGGAVPGNHAGRQELHEAGVFGFKCFTVDSGVPEFPPLDEAGLAEAMRQVAELGSLLVVHAEDAASIEAAAGRRYSDFVRSRPDAAEVAAVSRVIELAKETGARAHVLHLSSADAVPLLAAAQAAGVRVSAETCPHYLALAAEDIEPGQTQFKCCPPIRGAANSEGLWDALASGVISCVVSDHSPCPPELKRLEAGDFGAAWGGISSVQLGLPVVWTAAAERGFSLADVAGWMAGNSARLVGLGGKGAITAGRDADLVAFAPDERFVVTADRLLTRHRLTPYLGRELRGMVRKTWLRGVRAGAGQGRLLTSESFA